MGYSVMDAVSEILAEMHYLRPAFKYDLINYSALARMIQPMVAERMKEDVGLDAIIIAIRRYVHTGAFDMDEKNIYRIVKDLKPILRTDMCYITFHRSDEIYRALIELERSVDRIAGEKMYINQRSDEISVVAMSRFLPKLLEITKGDNKKIKHKAEGLALLTLLEPPEGVYVPGVTAFVSGQLASIGVNMVCDFTSYSYLSFLIDERDAAAAYDKINSSIQMAKKYWKELG
ncbi:Uncharacterised protein [Candidatus Norongarragalina meridionalis]|nr:Uncharacterised protein [Candidatus Norongarragalina meridionalis]